VGQPIGIALPGAAQVEFEVADFNNDRHVDIFAIQKSATQSGYTEIHARDGAMDFGAWLQVNGHGLVYKATPIAATAPERMEYELGDYNRDGVLDLYAIQKLATQSGLVEVQILSGAWGGFRNVLKAQQPIGIGASSSNTNVEFLINQQGPLYWLDP
jgi:hypothetical protein